MSNIIIERAAPADIPAMAALFTRSFKQSVLHHCGCLPKPQAMEDVFALIRQTEPAAAFVARLNGQTIGYCFAPAGLSRIWRRAVWSGALFKWAWHWATGQYGFGFYPVKIILMNKFFFLKSALAPANRVEARILSIAVDKKQRGQGVGRALLASALAYFDQRQVPCVRLEVRPDNLPAIAVYRHFRFVLTGKTRDLQGEWLIMQRSAEQDR